MEDMFNTMAERYWVVFFDNHVINLDDEETYLSLMKQGAEEIPVELFGSKVNHASNENTKKVDGKWVFTPPADKSAEEVNEMVILQRKRAYRLESDPLYLEWQFDKSDEAEAAWRDKVAEIKERLPLMEE